MSPVLDIDVDAEFVAREDEIAEFFEELLNEANEMSLDKDMLEQMNSQGKLEGVKGKVRQLSDEEREELR